MRSPKRSPSAVIIGRSEGSKASRGIGFVIAPPTRAQRSRLRFYDGSGHITSYGPTAAGKTLQAISNTLACNGPAVIFDSKGDIYQATARHRRTRGEVHIIDFSDMGNIVSGSLNPVDLALRCGTERAVIARDLAAMLTQRTGAERDRFWVDTGETTLTGGFGWVLGLPPDQRNIGTVWDLFNKDEVIYAIAILVDTEGHKMDKATKAAFTALLSMPERETRPSVVATTQASLRLFDSEMVRQRTATTSFDIDAFLSGDHCMTLYLTLPAHRESLRPLARMLFNLLLAAHMQRRYEPAVSTLFLSDETASFGKIDGFITAVTQARSFHVRLWTHWQNYSQTAELYGQDGARTLVDNSGVLQLLGAGNYRMASEFAQLVGGITAEEIMAMSRDQQVALVDGKVERLRKIRYFEEPMFEGQYDPVKSPTR